MTVLGPAILLFEAVVVLLAMAVGIQVYDLSNGEAAVLAGSAGLAVLAAALIRWPIGRSLGSVVQVLMLLSGFWIPVMFGLGLLFGALWVAAVIVVRKADAAAGSQRG